MEGNAKKRRFKWWIIPLIIMAINLITGIIAIVVMLYSQNVGETDDITEQVQFDLEQYDEYGNLSCGLIWVQRTTSSYDSAEKTEFAYLDVDGNVKSEWYNRSDWQPADFSQDILVLRGKYELRSNGYYAANPPSEVHCKVLNKEFEEIKSMYCLNVEVDGLKNAAEIVITDADENGYVYAIDSEKNMWAISEDKEIRFDIAENKLAFASVKNLERINMDNGYFIVDIRDSLSNFPQFIALFDENGKMVIEPSEEMKYTVYSVDVISDEEIAVMFEGKDGNMYDATIDFDGNFVEEPH